MALFKKKKEEVIQSYNTETVEGAVVYVVSWNSLYGHYPDAPHLVSCRRVAKAFVNEGDADKFVESLKAAESLLQNGYNLGIEKETQA